MLNMVITLADAHRHIRLTLLLLGACGYVTVDQYLESMIGPLIVRLEFFVSGLTNIAEKGKFNLPSPLLCISS